MKTLSIPSYETKSAGKNVERLKKPLTRLQVKKHVLEMGEKFGLDSPRRNSRLADCLVNFSAAPDLTALRRFKKDLEFIASTKPGGSPLEEKIPARELFQLKTDIHNVIVWALDEKPKDTQKHKDKSVSTAPLEPIEARLHLDRVGGQIEQSIVALDLRGRVLLRLLDLLSRQNLPFARCATCRKPFARRGRRLYCGSQCQSRARPREHLRKYNREYMRKRRIKLKRLKGRLPNS